MEGTGYIADILRPDGSILEIQTRGFSRLKKKLPALLEQHPVTVVYPLPRTKWLLWIDDATGEISRPRRSPKRGVPYDIFFELRWITPVLTHPRLTFCILEVDVEEYRHLDGWSRDGKKGSTRAERIPVAYGAEYRFGGACGWAALFPPGLPETFTAREFQRAAGISEKLASSGIYVLRHAGAMEEAGRQSRTKVYRRSEAGIG